MGAKTPSERPQDIYDELMGLPERYSEIRRSNFKSDTLVKFVSAVAFITLESGGNSTAKHVLAKRHFNAIEKALLPLAKDLNLEPFDEEVFNIAMDAAIDSFMNVISKTNDKTLRDREVDSFHNWKILRGAMKLAQGSLQTKPDGVVVKGTVAGATGFQFESAPNQAKKESPKSPL